MVRVRLNSKKNLMRHLLCRPLHTFRAFWSNLFGYDVFITYARVESKGLARRIEVLLKRHGFTVFRDYSGLIGGDTYRMKLRDAAARCRLHVLILGEHAMVSRWVTMEVRARWAYQRLMTRKKRKPVTRPFFPVFDTSLDWSIARSCLRKTSAYHGLTFKNSERAVAKWDALAITTGIENAFRGWRARKIWALLTITLITLGTCLILFVILLHLSMKWREQSLAWQRVADAAETGRRYLEAELAWSNAVDADWRVRESLTPRYLAARSKRLLSPSWSFKAPGKSFHWIGNSQGLPVIVLEDQAEACLLFYRIDGRMASIPKRDTFCSFVQSDHGIAVLTGKFLWLVDLEAEEGSRIKSLPHGMSLATGKLGLNHPEMRLKSNHIHVLGLSQTPAILKVRLSSWSVSSLVPLDLPESATSVSIAETNDWLAVSVEQIPVSDPRDPISLNLYHFDNEGRRHAKTGIPLPNNLSTNYNIVRRVISSRDDQQAFVELDVPDSLPGPHYKTWIVIPKSSVRQPFTMDHGITDLKTLYMTDETEAMYSVEDGDLRVLSFQFPLLYPRTRTILAQTSGWAITDLGRKYMDPVSVAILQDRRLHLFKSQEPVLEIYDKTLGNRDGFFSLVATDDGMWLAAASTPEAKMIKIWRVGVPPLVKKIPVPIELTKELSFTQSNL